MLRLAILGYNLEHENLAFLWFGFVLCLGVAINAGGL